MFGEVQANYYVNGDPSKTQNDINTNGNPYNFKIIDKLKCPVRLFLYNTYYFSMWWYSY